MVAPSKQAVPPAKTIDNPISRSPASPWTSLTVNHLDYLGVEFAWISGPWFLSIFINMLPWETVLQVWDALLYEGNRVMLFRTALALMDLYGPAVVTTKDAGDAITLFQTLTGSTFDSSQLVLTACIGFLTIDEDRLQNLKEKHRPAILAAVKERAKGTNSYAQEHNRNMHHKLLCTWTAGNFHLFY